MCVMRLVKIKNRYLFKGNNPNGTHTYATYYDRQNKRYNVVQLTHLYVKDANRFKQVQRGDIMIIKFKEFDVPSGVEDKTFRKTVKGQPINEKYLTKTNSRLNKWDMNKVKGRRINKKNKG